MLHVDLVMPDLFEFQRRAIDGFNLKTGNGFELHRINRRAGVAHDIGIGAVVRQRLKRHIPTVGLIAFAMLLVTGLYFNADLTLSVTVKAVDPALIPSFMSLILVFFAPLLTMRMLAEETREGTLELLLTAPVSDNAIVIGKF